MKIFIVLLCVSSTVVIGGLFSWWNSQKETDPDQQVLDQLKKAGSNLSKPHQIESFLYFPTEDSANRATVDLEKEEGNVKVELGADTTSWLCFATKQLIPKHSELLKLPITFNEIAQKLNGDYDGWGTEIVKQEQS